MPDDFNDDFADPNPEDYLPVVPRRKGIDEMDAQAFAVAVAESGGITEFVEEGAWTVTDKADLINRPFAIAAIRFNKGEKSAAFVSVCAFLENGDKIVFNDGS